MSSDRIWFFSEDVNVSCCECGKETTLNPDFDEVAGDLRLNFVKVRSTIPDSGTCPQCGNEDDSSGCSVEGLASLFETYALDHPDDLELNVSSAQELIGHLYGETHDEALLAVGESLKNGNSVESVIPELKRIIDSHDDVLKDKYLGEFLP